MDKLLLFTALSGAAAFLALLWLSIRAFRRHLGWGFLVLLLSPIGASIFGISHWDEEKRPFLAYLGSFLLSVSLSFYLFTAWGGWEMLQAGIRVQQGIEAQNLTREEAQAFMHTSMNFMEKAGLEPDGRPQAEAAGAQPAEQQTAARPEAVAAGPVTGAAPEAADPGLQAMNKKIEPPKQRYRLEYMPIDVAEAGNYVGYTVKVTRKGLREKEYRLTDVSHGRLRLAQRNSHFFLLV